MTKSTGKTIISLLLILIIVFAGLYFRHGDCFTNPQMYAEDGPIFWQQFEEMGIRSLWMPYAGYLHIIPRLVAMLFGCLQVDLLYIPLCYNLSCFVICCLIAIELWRGAGYMGIKHRILYATIFIFVPVSAEMYMNLTNTIWFTSLYLVNFLLIGYKAYDAEKWKGLKLVVLLLVSLTGPFSLLLSPVIILILVLERKTIKARQVIPFAVILAGAIIQLLHIKYLAPPMDRTIEGTPEPLHLLKFIKYNISDLVFAKSERITSHINYRVMTIFCLFVFLLLNYYLFRQYLRIDHLKRKYVLLLTPLVYLGSAIAVFWPMETHVLAFYSPRYFFVPYTCFAWIFILGSDRILHYTHIFLYFLYFTMMWRLTTTSFWDRQWAQKVKEYKQGKRQEIDIPPDGWSIRLPPYRK